MRRSASLFFLGLLIALPAFAYRREYAVTWDGQRKPGSEVCFYRGERGDAFALFFTPGDVRCLPADAILDFPPGLIHVFARHKDGYASMQRDYSIYDGPPNPERGYEKLETPLVRAGIVDFAGVLKKLAANQRLGVWLTSTPSSTSTFIPLVPGETTILAPAEMTVVPLLVENGLPSAVGEPLYLQPGERQAALFKPQRDSSDVILWTHVDTQSTHDARGLLQPPAITLNVGDQTFRPVAPLYAPESGTLLIFRGVRRGNGFLTAAGSMWKPVTRAMNVLPQAVTIEREAVPLVAGGSVEVRWSTEDARTAAVECPGARTQDVPLVRAALLECTIAADGKKKCSTVEKMTAPYDVTSSLEFDGVAAGSYSVVVEPPYGKQQLLAADVVTGQQTILNATFPSFSFFGTVKVNGKPVHARLIFFTGQAISDSEGRYMATLAVDPNKNQVQIEPCAAQRTFTFIPPAGPAPNAAFDMDVRLATLDVQVTDPHGRPVAGAAVRFSPVKEVMADGHVATYFGSENKQTDAEGHVAFDDLPEGFRVIACAKHSEFVGKCSDPVDPKKLDGTPMIVQFDPAGMRGRVEGHSGFGSIAIVNATGVLLEDVQIDPDGAFRFRLPHAAPEHLVYISESRPLTVLPLPLVPPAELVVQIPAVPVRSFNVTVPNMRADLGYLGIWVDGMFVPVQTFNTHMEMRGLDSLIHRGTNLRVTDIAETGTISVAFSVMEPAAKVFVDPFTLPQYAGVARVAVKTNEVALPQ